MQEEMGGSASRAASTGGAFEIDEDEEASRGCCGCFAKGVSRCDGTHHLLAAAAH